MTERELARRTIEHLTASGWACHEEVGTYGEPRCDIVATKGGVIWAIEAKTHFGFGVLAQADAWLRRGVVNRASVAVPQARDDDARAWGYGAAKRAGIGVLLVGHRGVLDWIEPQDRTLMSQRLVTQLHPDQVGQGTSGTNRGGYSTKFSRTCAALVAEVSARPGIKVSEFVAKCQTHYATPASARSNLGRMLHARRPVSALAAIRIDDQGRLWPQDTTELNNGR